MKIVEEESLSKLGLDQNRTRMMNSELSEPTSVLESILWNSSYYHLDKHLHRLETSAHYLNYPFSRDEVLAKLIVESTQFLGNNLYKIRLLLNHLGKIHLEVSQIQDSLDKDVTASKVRMSAIHTDSQQWYYYHKTTRRPLYNRATHFACEHGYADIIFFNERGEITEGAISNIYIQKKGYFLTPPLHCGVLNGIYRQHLLETHEAIKEELLYPEDLFTAESIYISNAIRGLRQVTLSTLEATF